MNDLNDTRYYLNIFFKEIINTMCIFLLGNELCKGCGKQQYGGYCYKHRSEHLLDEHKMIDRKRFTNKESDYLKKNIIRTLSRIYQHTNLRKKKHDLFLLLVSFFQNLQSYSSDETLQKIIKIQRYHQNKSHKLFTKLRGCLLYTSPSPRD